MCQPGSSIYLYSGLLAGECPWLDAVPGMSFLQQLPLLTTSKGRDCIGSQLVIPDYAKEPEPSIINYLNVSTPEGVDATILAFVIVITLTNITMCGCQVRNYFSPRSEQSECPLDRASGGTRRCHNSCSMMLLCAMNKCNLLS